MFYVVLPAKVSFSGDVDGHERGKLTRVDIVDRKLSKQQRCSSMSSKAVESSIKIDAILEAQQHHIASRFSEQLGRTRCSIASRLDVPARPKWPGLLRAWRDGDMLPTFLMDRLAVESVE